MIAYNPRLDVISSVISSATFFILLDPDSPSFSLPRALGHFTFSSSSSSSATTSDELRFFSVVEDLVPCWSAVPRSNLGDRRGGGDCLTTPTTCPGEEEHVLQLREAAATQRTRLVHTYGRDRLPLFPLARCWECWGFGLYRYLESNEDERTQNHASFLASRTFDPSLDNPLLSSDTSTSSLFVLLF